MKTPFLLLALAGIFLLAGCRTARHAADGSKQSATAVNAESTARRAVAHQPKAQTMTARIMLELSGVGKNLSVSGSLRMKRDDVIQLSISFLGMELGRMEFTKDYAMIIDRFHKQYVKETYDKVNFLTRAGLNFDELQALFWNTVFVPGQPHAADALGRFGVSATADSVVLNLTDAPELNYTFVTRASDAGLLATRISSKDARDNTQFECRYGQFTRLAGDPFPAAYLFKLRALRRDFTVSMTLSRINTSDDWEKRTEVSSKYKERRVNEIMRQLISVR